MASKTLDLLRDGRNLRIRIAASDLTVSRVSRAFQASKFVHALIYNLVAHDFVVSRLQAALYIGIFHV